MSNILDLLKGGFGDDVVSNIAAQTGTSKQETSAVVMSALPVLLGALQGNANSNQGAQGILGAINTKHDGSILDNLSAALGPKAEADGNGILGHILGGKQSALTNSLSQKTGVSSANVSKIIALLAPVVMGYLGRQAKSKNVKDGNGLNDLLGGLLGGSSGGGIGDLLGSVLGGSSKSNSGGLGGLLGGLGGLLGKK